MRKSKRGKHKKKRGKKAPESAGDQVVEQPPGLQSRQVYPPPSGEAGGPPGLAAVPSPEDTTEQPPPAPGRPPEVQSKAPPAAPEADVSTPTPPPPAGQEEIPTPEGAAGPEQEPVQPPEPEPEVQPPIDYYQHGYYPPPVWYPPVIMPPGYGFQPVYPVPPPEGGKVQDYGAAYPGAPEKTGPIPAVPVQPPGVAPVPMPGVPTMGPAQPFPGQPGVPAPPVGIPVPPPDVSVLDAESEFRELVEPEAGHWRGDLKWITGILAAFFLFVTLAIAGSYFVTGSGRSRDALVDLIESGTLVRENVEDNYQELRSKARQRPSAEYVIPDIGVEVRIEGSDITNSNAEDLADIVVGEVAKTIYAEGYQGNLPMEAPKGVGEERARATVSTFLATLNKSTHGNLFWPIIIFAGLTMTFLFLAIFFCRGWGRVYGSGLVVISAALLGSLLLRIGTEFVWGANTADFRGAANQALRSTAAGMVPFYDIALGLGAILVLVGVIGAVVARRAEEREPPFVELKRPEEIVVGGPAVEPGLEPVEEEEVSEDAEEASRAEDLPAQ